MRYGEIVQRLKTRSNVPLYPNRVWDETLSKKVTELPLGDMFGSEVRDEEAAEAVRAGLLQWNDALDASHRIAQTLETAEGSFWHAIMHRREGDHSNSKYWYSQVGHHAILDQLYAESLILCSTDENLLRQFVSSTGRWNSSGYVDLCAEVSDGKEQHRLILEQIQLREITFLLTYCRQMAVGAPVDVRED